jgi:hypothetical protein
MGTELLLEHDQVPPTRPESFLVVLARVFAAICPCDIDHTRGSLRLLVCRHRIDEWRRSWPIWSIRTLWSARIPCCSSEFYGLGSRFASSARWPMTLSIGWKAGEIRTVRSAQNFCCFRNTISSSQGDDTGADSEPKRMKPIRAFERLCEVVHTHGRSMLCDTFHYVSNRGYRNAEASCGEGPRLLSRMRCALITAPCRSCNGTGQSLLLFKCRAGRGTGKKTVCPNFLSHLRAQAAPQSSLPNHRDIDAMRNDGDTEAHRQ